MDKVIFKKASVQDVETVKRISRETFYETFAKSNTEAAISKYMSENFSTEKITNELSNPNSFFYIAFIRDEPVGYLKLNTGNAQTEKQGDPALEIERIYVKALYHGKHIGQLLYEKALEIAAKEQKSFVWLGVWEENARAIRFYEKNGFISFDKHVFMMGDDKQIDIMMKKVLR
jgi:ribosomal protein S18 acetylase RimI-like enzyme